MRIMRSLAVVAALLCALVVPLRAAPPMTKIRVEVKTLSGKPIDRASVVVHCDQGRSVLKLGKQTITKWELRTNQDGVAKVPELPQGKIKIMVIAKGYQTFGETFDIAEEEKTVEIKLNPPQPQHSAHQ